MNCWGLTVPDTPGEPRLRRIPSCRDFYPRRFTKCSQWKSEKSPLTHLAQEGGSSRSETGPGPSAFPHKACPLEKLFSQSLTNVGGRKNPTPVLSGHPVSPGGGRWLKGTCEGRSLWLQTHWKAETESAGLLLVIRDTPEKQKTKLQGSDIIYKELSRETQRQQERHKQGH